MTVHNHGPNRGEGLDCPEYLINGQLKGRCIKDHYEHWLQVLKDAEAMRTKAMQELGMLSVDKTLMN